MEVKVKSVIYAFIAIVLYATQNVVIDVKLKQYSTVSLLLGFYLILLPLGGGLFLWQKLFGQEIRIPTGSTLGIVAFAAVMFFIADFFYVGAYTTGGNVVGVTVVAVLMPVLGAAMKFLWIKTGAPTRYHVAGFIFAALAVIFVALGDKHAAVK